MLSLARRRCLAGSEPRLTALVARHLSGPGGARHPLLAEDREERGEIEQMLRSGLVSTVLMESYEAGKRLDAGRLASAATPPGVDASPGEAPPQEPSETQRALAGMMREYRVRPSPLKPLAHLVGFAGGVAATVLKPVPGVGEVLDKAVTGAVSEAFNDGVRSFHTGPLASPAQGKDHAELKEAFIGLRRDAEAMGGGEDGESPLATGVRPNLQNAAIAAAKFLITLSRTV